MNSTLLHSKVCSCVVSMVEVLKIIVSSYWSPLIKVEYLAYDRAFSIIATSHIHVVSKFRISIDAHC